eukprot:m.253065 g.253065  ORF g.253065 m.253065 type:complete len:113 (+) comp40364_c2_seq8:642-980(+)
MSGTTGSVCKQFSFSVDVDGAVSLEEKRQVTLPSSGVSAVAVREDRKICAVGSWSGQINVFGWKKLKHLFVSNFHVTSINALHFSPSQMWGKKLLAVGAKEKRLSIWDLYSD